jgi:hypothetical protein
VTGDSGFFSGRALQAMKEQGVDLYAPDNNLKHEMQTGERARGIGNQRIRNREHRRMRGKLRTRTGQSLYQRRQAVVEAVYGILKEQRGMRKFRRRGLAAVSTARETRAQWRRSFVGTDLFMDVFIRSWNYSRDLVLASCR